MFQFSHFIFYLKYLKVFGIVPYRSIHSLRYKEMNGHGSQNNLEVGKKRGMVL